MIIQDLNYFNMTVMGKNIYEPNTKTQINREKFKNIVHPIPKEKQGTSPVESPILLWRETSYGLG